MSGIARAGLAKMCCSVAAILGLGLICASPATAQEKHELTYKVRGEDTSYTTQHILDVGDMPGHQIRIAEVHRLFPADNPLEFGGIRALEQYARFFSDFVNWSGPHWGYFVINMENGDRIYGRGGGNSRTTFLPDGSTKGTYSGMFTFVGGTGKFRGMRGTGLYTGIFDPTAGTNEATWELEYWME